MQILDPKKLFSILKPNMNKPSWLERVYDSLELVTIAITQEQKSVKGKFGNALVAKLGGAATSTGLLSAVGSLGTASTGTAIASLSGAAASTAKLYWVGSLIGGGVFAGAILTGGVGIAAGYGTMKWVKGSVRKSKDLHKHEEVAFYAAAKCMQDIKVEIENPREIPRADLFAFMEDNLIPLVDLINKNLQSSESGYPYKKTLKTLHYLRLKKAVKSIEELMDEQL